MPDVGRGQRRRVVDAVAGHRHDCALRAGGRWTTSAFRSGSTSASTSSMPSFCATASAVRAVVAGQHHDRSPARCKLRERLRRRRLDRIGDTDQSPSRLSVDGDEHHRLPLAPKLVCARRGTAPRVDAELGAGGRRCPSATASAGHTAATTPFPVTDWKSVGRGRLNAARLRAVHDRRRQRMLAASLEARGEPQQVALVERRATGTTDAQPRLALGQRPGLVDDQRVDLLQDFERLGVPDQHAGERAASGADHDRHRRRQPERARAGDDEDRDGVDEGVGEARLGAPAWPNDERQRRRPARPRARTTPRPRRPAAGSARGCAALRPPCGRSARAAFRRRRVRRA